MTEKGHHDFKTVYQSSEPQHPGAVRHQSDHYRGDIKLGLRNNDGTGVLVGVSKVGSVQGYLMQDGQRVPRPRASCTTAASNSTRSWRPTGRPALSASRR